MHRAKKSMIKEQTILPGLRALPSQSMRGRSIHILAGLTSIPNTQTTSSRDAILSSNLMSSPS